MNSGVALSVTNFNISAGSYVQWVPIDAASAMKAPLIAFMARRLTAAAAVVAEEGVMIVGRRM